MDSLLLFKPFHFRTERWDGNDTWKQVLLSVVIDPKDPEWKRRSPLRKAPIKTYGWRVDGVYLKAPFKASLHKPSKKRGFSKHRSTSYADPDQGYTPPPFGWDKSRNSCLVGLRFALKDTLPQRFMPYDQGTVYRPYQFDLESEARRAWNEYEKYQTYEGLVQHSDRDKQNEVMARLRFSLDDSSQVLICTDNLVSRLLSQLRERNLSARILNLYSCKVRIPISFYLPTKRNIPTNSNNFTYYEPAQQKTDLTSGLSSNDLQERTLARLVLAERQEFKNLQWSIFQDDIDMLAMFFQYASRLTSDTSSLLYQNFFLKNYEVIIALLRKHDKSYILIDIFRCASLEVCLQLKADDEVLKGLRPSEILCYAISLIEPNVPYEYVEKYVGLIKDFSDPHVKTTAEINFERHSSSINHKKLLLGL